MKENISIQKGFTLVETLVAFFIASALIALTFKLSGSIQVNYIRGNVDLQNLQEARYAINSIRRDFMCATPKFDRTDGIDIREAIRQNPVISASILPAGMKSMPIVVAKNELHMTKYSFDFESEKDDPIVENVAYFIDPVQRALIRMNSKGRRIFKAVKNAEFALYKHPLNQDIPMISVRLEVDYSETEPKKPLEIVTTVSSLIITQNFNNIHWNWDPQN